MNRIGWTASAIAVTGGVALTAAAVLVPSWRVEASEVSPATAQQIWTWYADAGRTPNWDHLVKTRVINGPFLTGTAGSNQGGSGPAFPWIFTEVVTDRHYTEVTRLPLASLTATHVLTSVANGTRIDHALIVSGPLAGLYRPVFYSSFASGIRSAASPSDGRRPWASTAPPPRLTAAAKDTG